MIRSSSRSKPLYNTMSISIFSLISHEQCSPTTRKAETNFKVNESDIAADDKFKLPVESILLQSS